MPRKQLIAGILLIGLAAAARADDAWVANPAEADPNRTFPVGDGADNFSPLRAGAGVLLLTPLYDANPAFSRSRQFRLLPFEDHADFVPTTRPSFEQQDFETEMAASPRLWLSYSLENGLGVTARYWYFHQSEGESFQNRGGRDDFSLLSATVASPTIQGIQLDSSAFLGFADFYPEQFSASSKTILQVGDLEVDQKFQSGLWACKLAGGIRFAHLAEKYEANLIIPAGIVSFSGLTVSPSGSLLSSEHTFFGVGPLAGIDFHRPVGWGFSIIGGARGSLLFGSARQNTSQYTYFSTTLGVGPGPRPIPPGDLPQVIVGPGQAAFASSQTATWRQDKLLPITEAEVGLEWSNDFGDFLPFIQATFVGQSWFGAGSPSSTSGNLGLVGANISAGVRF